MSPSTIHKLTGGALIGSAVVSLAGGLAHPVVDGQAHNVASLTAPLSPWAQLGIYAGALLLMAGLPGLFGWLSSRIGALGLTGVALYFLGNALSAQSHLVVEAFVAPAIARDPGARHLIADDGSIIDSGPFLGLQVAGGLVFMLGLLLIGIGLLRSRAVPRWIGVVFIGAAVVAFTPLPEAPVLSGLQIELLRGLGVAALGLLMIRTPGAAPAGHSSLPSAQPVSV